MAAIKITRPDAVVVGGRDFSEIRGQVRVCVIGAVPSAAADIAGSQVPARPNRLAFTFLSSLLADIFMR
jgi:hypothetical protein